MKNIKLFILTAMVMATCCVAAIFTSCTKSSCTNMVCQNGGTCSGGNCQCPTGFSGSLCQLRATSAIQYINDTYTPISIAVNGNSQTIPVGGKVTFAGQYGIPATTLASTSGTAGSLGIDNAGAIIGLTINWSRVDSFPISDTLRIPLDVGATYFFLKLINTGTKNVIDYYVNYQFPYGETYEDITVPNNSTTYNMGYYLAYANSNVQAQASNGTTPQIIWRAVTLPFTSNQSFTATLY